MSRNSRLILMLMLALIAVLAAAGFWVASIRSRENIEAIRLDVARATSTTVGILQMSGSTTLADAQLRIDNADSDIGEMVRSISRRDQSGPAVSASIEYLRGIQDLLRADRGAYKAAETYFQAQDAASAQSRQYSTPPFNESTEASEKAILLQKQLERDQAERSLTESKALLKSESVRFQVLMRKIRPTLAGYSLLTPSIIAQSGKF